MSGARRGGRTVGSPQIRNRATIGGNIGTASPAGDALPVLAAYDATVVAGSARGHARRIPGTTFFTGPKRDALTAGRARPRRRMERRATGRARSPRSVPRNAMVIAVAGLCLQLDVRAHMRAACTRLGRARPSCARPQRRHSPPRAIAVGRARPGAAGERGVGVRTARRRGREADRRRSRDGRVPASRRRGAGPARAAVDTRRPEACRMHDPRPR